ncbi:PQQ-binding-like beta-propeller repeat protein [candidate division WOR-3 bacterium]|nr:PQQ-binding-like beta-propeller repeat protein [candidate division WOR-3 bacterium]
MLVLLLIISISSIDIQSPVDGFTYQEDTIELRCYVEDSIPPQLFWYYLNSEGPDTVERTITDWYTYCQNDTHTGYSKSPVPDDPPILWKKDSISWWHAFCQPVIVNGVVYWASEKEPGTLYAFRAYDGYELWRIDSIGRVDDAVTYHKGRIYCLSEDSIWCIDARTGFIYWSKPPGTGSTTPAVKDGRVYYTTSTSTNDTSFVYCRIDTTGDLIWKDTILSYSPSTITLWQDRLYCPFCDRSCNPSLGEPGNLVCFDATNGDIIWERSDSFNFWDSAPLIADSTLFIGSDLPPDQLLALDPFTGATIWKNTLNPFSADWYLSATPTYHQGRVFIGLESMYCIDAETGEIIWEYSLMLDYVHNTNVIADGCIITNNYGGSDTLDNPNLLVIDEYTGYLKWYKEYSHSQSHSAPSIADGVIYIAPGDGTFYAYGTGLKFVYNDQLLSLQDTNNLIVFARDSSGNILSDTIEFFVNMGGLSHYRRTNNGKSLLTAVSSNPFIRDVLIEYTILKKSSIRLSIYDVSGKEIRTLKSGVLNPGTYQIKWKGRDNQGNNMPQGVYFLNMRISTGYNKTLKLIKFNRRTNE